MATESINESEGKSKNDDADFVDYLARRLGVETREARERLSAWLSAYEAPPRSGVRKTIPEPAEPAIGNQRSA